MSIAVTAISCAWDAPRSNAKLMLNAPKIFAYLRMPTPLAWPATVLAYREVRQRASLALGARSIKPSSKWELPSFPAHNRTHRIMIDSLDVHEAKVALFPSHCFISAA